jgi:S-formylglutathione hydrolase FrmB
VDAVAVSQGQAGTEPQLPSVPPRRRRLGRWATVFAIPLAVAVIAGLTWAVVAGRLDAVPLLDPALAVTVEAVSALALVGSWISRRRRWYLLGLPAVVLSAAVLTGTTAAVLWLTGTVMDAYPVSFGLWVGMAVATLVGLPFVLRRSAAVRKVAAVVAVPLTMSGALLLINDEYGQWPTLGDLLGHTGLTGANALHLPPDAGKNGKGYLAKLDPPATKSHFVHRPGSVYLPPAYFTSARAKLPVILMLAGAPGSTVQWPTSGKAIATADAYAAAHHGRAPILLFVDNNGSATGDTECVDGPRGNAETYLTVDVPAFVTKKLRVQQNAARWAVVGFSEGGTCAVDLALAHPKLFGHFVDLAGDAKPTLGDPEHTLSALFGGSATAMANHNPAHLLATHRYKGMTAWFAVGVNDRSRQDVSHNLAASSAKSGIKVHQFTGVAAHNWQFVSNAFERIIADLCTELGLR